MLAWNKNLHILALQNYAEDHFCDTIGQIRKKKRKRNDLFNSRLDHPIYEISL